MSNETKRKRCPNGFRKDQKMECIKMDESMKEVILELTT